MPLNKLSFEDYFWQCYFKFQAKQGEYRRSKNKDFNAYDSLNRNPEQVPVLLWQQLIRKHLKTHNYN